MTDCTEFLQWALPQLGRQWRGYRKVRRQVCKRIRRRTLALGLAGFGGYREYLHKHEEEWARLDSFCEITITRFFRDKQVFEFIKSTVFPRLVASGKPIRCWCIGSASGEEPYSLSIIFEHYIKSAHPAPGCQIVASEVNSNLIQRAEKGCYPEGALKDMPDPDRRRAFRKKDTMYRLKKKYKANVSFIHHDIREPAPLTPFDLVLCRNTVAIYFDERRQEKIFTYIYRQMKPGAYLILGAHERLPQPLSGKFTLAKENLAIYQKWLTKGE